MKDTTISLRNKSLKVDNLLHKGTFPWKRTPDGALWTASTARPGTCSAPCGRAYVTATTHGRCSPPPQRTLTPGRPTTRIRARHIKCWRVEQQR